MDGYIRLSERQKECLRLVGQGYTSKQIGRMLTISDRTVDHHIFLALDHVGIQHRAEAARALMAEEAKQCLPKQQPKLVETPIVSPPEDAAVDARSQWFSHLLPPFGGYRNTLDAEHKIYAIVRVAVFSLVSVIILSLALAVLLWLIR